MLEDTATTPVAGEQSPAPEVAPHDPSPTFPDVADQGADQETGEQTDGDETAEEAEEVDFEGKKYTLPKTLKDALLRQADYTRKTQEVAEQRRTVEARASEFDALRQVQEALADDVAEVKSLDKQIALYEKIDWDALISQDPVQAQRYQLARDQLKEARVKALGEMQQKGQKLTLDLEQRAARQIEQANQVLAREIPGWSPAKEAELVNFAKNHVGFADAELQALARSLHGFDGAVAKFARLVHMAEVGQRVVKQTTSATKPAPPATAKPAPSVATSGRAQAKDPSRMSTEEWVAWRRSNRK